MIEKDGTSDLKKQINPRFNIEIPPKIVCIYEKSKST